MSTNNGSDPRTTPNRTRRDARYASNKASNGTSIGNTRSPPPLPTTRIRRSPDRPPNDSTRSDNISADRIPVNNANANTARSRSGHGSRARRAPRANASNNRSGVSSPINGLGPEGLTRGRGTADIGLPATTRSATQNAKNPFHVDHARNTLEAARSSANSANASRNTPDSNSPNPTPAGSRPNARPTHPNTATRSRR
ncbi:hypothetical protein GCM10007079_18940 [Nocardiopsis terrae]|nr:hypothetical protein GCM10007079_18940 [Nocardiopsis terrae]